MWFNCDQQKEEVKKEQPVSFKEGGHQPHHSNETGRNIPEPSAIAQRMRNSTLGTLFSKIYNTPLSNEILNDADKEGGMDVE
jgi:hypothetical protein